VIHSLALDNKKEKDYKRSHDVLIRLQTTHEGISMCVGKHFSHVLDFTVI